MSRLLSLAREVEIVNRAGLHARPAAQFVRLAETFTCTIRIEKDDLVVNGKSIMGVLMLAAEFGSRIKICAEGPDAEEALGALADLLGQGLEEQEG